MTIEPMDAAEGSEQRIHRPGRVAVIGGSSRLLRCRKSGRLCGITNKRAIPPLQNDMLREWVHVRTG